MFARTNGTFLVNELYFHTNTVSKQCAMLSTALWDKQDNKCQDIIFCTAEALQILMQQQGVGDLDVLIDDVLTSLVKERCADCTEIEVRHSFANSGSFDGYVYRVNYNGRDEKCVCVKWQDGDTRQYGFKQAISFICHPHVSSYTKKSWIKKLLNAEKAIHVRMCVFRKLSLFLPLSLLLSHAVSSSSLSTSLCIVASPPSHCPLHFF